MRRAEAAFALTYQISAAHFGEAPRSPAIDNPKAGDSSIVGQQVDGFIWRVKTFMAKLPTALFLLAVVTGASAQTVFQGKILDATQAPIAGAKIVAVAQASTNEFVTVSGSNGAFSFNLEPGRYSIRVTREGFMEATMSLQFPQDAATARTITLTIAPVLASVRVTESTYLTAAINTATKTSTLLRDTPQSITVISQQQIRDQMMMSIGDVVRYVPGITAHQGENNRDQVIIRGNNSSADFFVNGVRDDVQYYRDLYNLEHVEALKGPNAMIFGRGGGGGVINRVTKEAGSGKLREISLQGGSFGNKRAAAEQRSITKATRVGGWRSRNDHDARHARSCRQAARRTWVPSSTIRPVSSATGMKAAGMTRVPSGSRSRASASTPVTRRLGSSTIGW